MILLAIQGLAGLRPLKEACHEKAPMCGLRAKSPLSMLRVRGGGGGGM